MNNNRILTEHIHSKLKAIDNSDSERFYDLRTLFEAYSNEFTYDQKKELSDLLDSDLGDDPTVVAAALQKTTDDMNKAHGVFEAFGIPDDIDDEAYFDSGDDDKVLLNEEGDDDYEVSSGNYHIYNVGNAYVLKNRLGKKLMEFPTEDEAVEFVRDMLGEEAELHED